MDSFLFCLILTFVIALGGREQLIIAQFTDALERTSALLVTGMVCAVASAGMMAFAGAQIAVLLPQRAADMLIAMALFFAAIELIWPFKLKVMKEPTRSFVAIGAVVFMRQVLDAARFVIFAFAAEATFTATAFIGGAIGGMAAVALGWSAGLAQMQQFPLRFLRAAMAVCLFLAALVIGLNARFTFL